MMTSEREKEDKSPLDVGVKDEHAQEDDDTDEVEEAAEVLMTDMTLDDDMDKIRDPDPGSSWIYHIEIYPWHADDINERFIRLIKLASFTNMSIRKKPISHESEDSERIDDKVMERQRKGSLHLYAESHLTARSILRHATWNNMVSRELTFEITKRTSDIGNVLIARVDVDTGSLSKVKFRCKTKGNFEGRTAKISNLPGEVTRDIIDIIFCRSYVAYNGPDSEPIKENKHINLQKTMAEMPGFNGSLDVDCLARGSCRSLVLAMKYVSIMGNELSITANDSQTMVVPPESRNLGLKSKDEVKAKTPADTEMTRNNVQIFSASHSREVKNNNPGIGRTSSLTRINSPASPAVQSVRIHPMNSAGRPRGTGVARGIVTTQQPAYSTFVRSGQGMPVPMTGRQKMNEKIRRNHPGVVVGAPNAGVYPPMAASAGFRAPNMKSIGDSFKHEIASLQSELERSTQAIEAKIERLKEESSYYSGYNDEMQMYMEGDWDQSHDFNYELGQEEYFDESQRDYYVQSYEVPPPDAMGYEFSFEQPIETVVPSNHTMSRRGAGRGGRGVVRVLAGGQQLVGYPVGNNSVTVRNPAHLRNVRGRGRGNGGNSSVVYHGPGTTSGNTGVVYHMPEVTGGNSGVVYQGPMVSGGKTGVVYQGPVVAGGNTGVMYHGAVVSGGNTGVVYRGPGVTGGVYQGPEVTGGTTGVVYQGPEATVGNTGVVYHVPETTESNTGVVYHGTGATGGYCA